MSILGPIKSLTHLAGQAFAAILHSAVTSAATTPVDGIYRGGKRPEGDPPVPALFDRTHLTSSTVEPPILAAVDEPRSSDPSTPGQPNLWPDWCPAEMEQVADILCASDSPFALGYANDLRRAAQARWASYEASFEATDPTLGNDPASVHERALRQRSNEDRSGGLR